MDFEKNKREDLFSKYLNICKKYKGKMRPHNRPAIQCSQDDLESRQRDEIKLLEEIKFCLVDEASASTRYVKLTEKYDKLQSNMSKLRSELKRLIRESVAEKKELLADCENKRNVRKNGYKEKIKEMETEFVYSQQQYDKKVKELQCRLEIVETTWMLQHDEMETELTKQLVDLNMKLRNVQNNISETRMEIDDLKSRQKRVSREYDIDEMRLAERNLSDFFDKELVTLMNIPAETSEMKPVEPPETKVKSRVDRPVKPKSVPNDSKYEPLATTVPKKNSKPKKRKLYKPDDVEHLDKLTAYE